MSTITHPQARPLSTRGAPTHALLGGGILAGPLFALGSLLHGFTREGFDVTRHGISMLLLGSRGWIQFLIFELAGFLIVATAAGARRVLHPGRAGTWGPLLIGGYGLGLIIAGIFPPDPAFGFPPGTPDSMPAMTANGSLHAVGFFVSMLSFIAGGIVLARRFFARRERGWGTYSAASAVATPVLVILSIVLAPHGGIALVGVLLVTGGWIAAVSAKLRAESGN
ncbi:MAG TPA: DUF998 domain-containing protein [Polyangiaceae bacterium]